MTQKEIKKYSMKSVEDIISALPAYIRIVDNNNLLVSQNVLGVLRTFTGQYRVRYNGVVGSEAYDNVKKALDYIQCWVNDNTIIKKDESGVLYGELLESDYLKIMGINSEL